LKATPAGYWAGASILDVIIATFLLGREAVALDQTLQEVPEAEIEAERIAAHSTHWTMPCIWIANADFDSVDMALADDPSVKNIVEKYKFENEKYYQVEWSDKVEDRIDRFVDKEASILAASANSEGWRIQIRFANRDQFDDFRAFLEAQGYSFDLVDLTEPGAPRQSYGELTPVQRNALVTAMENGYYRVPREATARDLADELDMSHQAVSELLRRGTENLIQSLLTTNDELSRE